MRKHICYTCLPIALLLAALVAGCGGGGGHHRRGQIVDTVRPTVTLVNPANFATDRPVGSVLVATFSEAMNPLTVSTSTFTVRQGNTVIPGTVVNAGNTATFTPNQPLAPGTWYQASISVGATDLAGNALALPYPWSFTTGGADLTPPVVVLVGPLDFESLVPIDRSVVATFSEPMDPLTVTDLTFTVMEQGGTPVTGLVTYSGNVATFTPSVDLLPGTQYTATITTVAADIAGNPLGSFHVWTFTTGNQAASPGAVALGELSHFAIIGGQAITNIPSSSIVGDLGVSPSAESFITGFAQTDAIGYATSPQVTGFIYAADMAVPTPAMLTQAKADLTIAYQDAAGRTPIPTGPFLNPGAGNLAGLNLAPGLYKFTGDAIATTSFTLTGGPDDVWIFQISTALIVSNGVKVTLAGGASARNVFWQVGTQATLGTTVAFQGTLMAEASITMQTGASLVGRVLAFSGTIALDQNSITLP